MAISERVRKRVADIDALVSAELSASDPVLREALTHTARPGEIGLRALFTVLAAQFGPATDTWQVTVAGAVVELVEAATRYHAGVSDAAQIRTSSSSAQTRWTNNLAILAGDQCFAVASRLVSRLGPEAVRIISETFAAMVTGQMRDRRGMVGDEVEHHLSVIDERTARLIATSGRFGAMFSGAQAPEIERLSRLGSIVGRLFHIGNELALIVNDFDAAREASAVQIHDSLRITLPARYALRTADREANRLRSLLAKSVSTEDDLAETLQLLRTSPGMDEAKSTVRQLASQARGELAGLPAGANRHALEGLVDYASARPGSVDVA